MSNTEAIEMAKQFNRLQSMFIDECQRSKDLKKEIETLKSENDRLSRASEAYKVNMDNAVIEMKELKRHVTNLKEENSQYVKDLNVTNQKLQVASRLCSDTTREIEELEANRAFSQVAYPTVMRMLKMIIMDEYGPDINHTSSMEDRLSFNDTVDNVVDGFINTYESPVIPQKEIDGIKDDLKFHPVTA